eukprot:TRINITY_DN14528_c0_g1_i3.p1 TRINITY_DN14528_c0_g1~~TRINITY_DN14528_c0_g1_i3.p1  ORF type:complete len:148 (-),score=9.47 TRINITY_DN14528_c0_g1_i3:561-1004(-)
MILEMIDINLLLHILTPSCTIMFSIQAEDGIRDLVRSRGLGDVYKRQNLGLNPATAGENIRVPMPPLTEETRKGYIKQARSEAENARVSVRNVRRDANGDLKDLLKEKEITEDDQRRGEDQIQKITDKYVAEVDALLEQKEKDLMEI